MRLKTYGQATKSLDVLSASRVAGWARVEAMKYDLNPRVSGNSSLGKLSSGRGSLLTVLEIFVHGVLEFITLDSECSGASTRSQDGLSGVYIDHRANGDDIDSWATDDTTLSVSLMYILGYHLTSNGGSITVSPAS